MGALKYKKQVQTDLKEQADNTPCSAMDRASRDKTKREQWSQTIH